MTVLPPNDKLVSLDALCDNAEISVAADDGVLLVRFTRSGKVLPVVLQLGIMTEGRMEQSIMPIYLTINRARVVARNESKKV